MADKGFTGIIEAVRFQKSDDRKTIYVCLVCVGESECNELLDHFENLVKNNMPLHLHVSEWPKKGIA